MDFRKKLIQFSKIGLVALLFAANFWSLARQLSQARQLVDTDGVFIPKYEERFDPVKAALPFKHGVIGYVADWDLRSSSKSEANSEGEHILTQYTMSPIVVSRNTDREWILVNLNPEDFETWFGMQSGNYEVTQFKYNLYLVRRTE